MISTSKKYGYLNNLKFMLKQHSNFEKTYLFCQLGLMPLSAITSVIAAYLPKVVLDCIERQTSPTELLLRVGVMSLVMIIFGYSQTVLQQTNYRSYHLSRGILFHRMMSEKIMSMDYNNYTYNEVRVKREKAWNAFNSWEVSVARFIEINCRIASAIFGFSAFTAIIVQCNVWFIPILVVSYGLSALGWMLLQKYNNSKKDEFSAARLKLGYVTFHSKDFSGAKDIRVYNMTDFLMRKIDRHLNEVQSFFIKRNNGHYINVLLEDFLKFGIGLGAYIYLIYLKLNSSMTLGDFSLYFGAITGFGVWLNTLVDTVNGVIESNHNVNDFRSFLDIEDTMNKGEGAELPKFSEPCEIELKNLSFTYDAAEKRILDNISLKIKAGEKIAVVGVNGAGKSTLVKLICGLFVAQEGKVLINGTDSREFNRDEYYKLFSTLFQDVSLLPSTIEKNIALCEESRIDRLKLKKCMTLAGIADKVESLPDKEKTLLVREVHEGATALSGGELQRLLLARALYKDAPIIILDEPTAALDPIAENDMYLKYNELTEGKTAIYISHRLSSTRFCDRIILLDESKIAEIGTHEELLDLGGKYAEMFKIQSKYYREGEAV